MNIALQDLALLPLTPLPTSSTSLYKNSSALKRLARRRCRHIAFGGQHGKKSFNLLGSPAARMRHLAIATMPADVKPYPIQIGFFSTQAIVKIANPLPDVIKQTGEMIAKVGC